MIFKNIEELAQKNTRLREVIYNGAYSHLTSVCLSPQEDIGETVDAMSDHIIVVVQGTGEVHMEELTSQIEKHSMVYITAGENYNIINTGEIDMKLYMISAH